MESQASPHNGLALLLLGPRGETSLDSRSTTDYMGPQSPPGACNPMARRSKSNRSEFSVSEVWNRSVVGVLTQWSRFPPLSGLSLLTVMFV